MNCLGHVSPPDEIDGRRQIRRRAPFNRQVLLFFTVNAGLLAINLAATPDRLWFAWPLLAWSILLVTLDVARLDRWHLSEGRGRLEHRRGN